MNGKQKLLIVNNNLDTGGIQRALVNLLYELDKEKLFDIDLFLFSISGKHMTDIPPSVKVIEGNKLVKILGISQIDSKKLGMGFYLFRGLAVIYTKIINRVFPVKLILYTQRRMKGYDVAISFMHDPNENTFYGGCNNFVIDRVTAKRKITFVHCDFLSYGMNNSLNRLLYGEFDTIATVSERCKDKFISANPKLKNSVITVLNCNNYEKIIGKSNENSIIYEKSNFNIVTVSRISEEKGIIRTINVIEKLLETKRNILWHIVGTGSLESEVKAIIKAKKLEKNIIMYGNQGNPYRYMKNADLFLLPSFHEAAPMVFDEAKCLGLPILATETTSTQEMVIEAKAGWVCGNSVEGIEKSLQYILCNRYKIDEVRSYLLKQKYNNKTSLMQFQNMLEEGAINE
ncbi:glycosyltransferase [Clostridium estertheticum]|uniref:glycosyltransferase n=1 Tax=Clostridium estertheticum TaxID=238834 RepID=UPI0013E98424|nr:glycosyltransferase [Clostridium estertheticum]MBZ9689214.1 glycosyltransferase [Clostridium estertheticum]